MERSGAGGRNGNTERQKEKQKQEYKQLIDDDGIFEVVKYEYDKKRSTSHKYICKGCLHRECQRRCNNNHISNIHANEDDWLLGVKKKICHQS